MYARSRLVDAPTSFAFRAASTPVFHSLGVGGAQIGCRFDIATPHHAMLHFGSASAPRRNDFSASAYQNEWISATPRSTSFCAAALHEVARCALPILPRSTSC